MNGDEAAESCRSGGVREVRSEESAELFLEEMEGIVSWSAMEALVRPHYAKAGNGRQPVGLSIMLRTYFVQQWFNLSVPGWKRRCTNLPRCGGSWAWTRRCSGARRDDRLPLPPSAGEARSGRSDAGGCERASGGQGHPHCDGTIVDATIIHAPSSTKNKSGERDPEMHQTRKGNQWCVSRT